MGKADPVKDACAERCAEFGEPPCYEAAPESWAIDGPCADCLRECGFDVPEPLDPAAVVGRLL